MAYRELGMAEVREIFRRWLRGDGVRGDRALRTAPSARGDGASMADGRPPPDQDRAAGVDVSYSSLYRFAQVTCDVVRRLVVDNLTSAVTRPAGLVTQQMPINYETKPTAAMRHRGPTVGDEVRVSPLGQIAVRVTWP